MQLQVTLYKNTGFNAQNRPARPEILEEFESVVYPTDIFDWQHFDKASIKIRTTWQLVTDVDYVKLHATDTESYDTYFTVNRIQMLNPQTAEMFIQLDGLMSCGGIDNINIISGWAKRAHVSDDTLFGNTTEEPFVPQEELIIDGTQEYERVSTANTILVGATIQINEATKAADAYTDGTGQIAVYVPKVESVKEGSTTSMILPTLGTQTKQLPNLQLFNFDSEIVQEGIQSTRSLGLSDAITACYTLGNRMHSQIEYISNGEIASITGVSEDVNLTAIPFRYSGVTIRNQKVYALYNLLRATSVCSGDAADYEMHKIYMNNASYPVFTFFTDPAPEGSPYMQPKYYLNAQNRAFLQCMKGMPWQNTPYSFDTNNGDLLQATMFERKQRQAVINAAGNALSGAEGAIGAGLLGGNPLAAVSGALSTAQNVYNDVQNYSNNELEFQQNRNLVVPEIAFPRDQSIQDYVGNGFFFYRVRLSNNDALRLDRFLTQFGYAVDKPLEKADFTNRQYFNYVQAANVQIDVARPLRMRNLASAELSKGVRLWHTAPSYAATQYNPIRTGG